MEKFTRTIRGYDPTEVNNFLDSVIKQVEEMVKELEVKEARINALESFEAENKLLIDKLEQFERMETTLNKAIIMSQKTADQIKSSAQNESEIIIEDAKRNASRIVNEALMRAEKTEREASMLRRNINIFKRRLRDIVESQIEVIGEIDRVEL